MLCVKQKQNKNKKISINFTGFNGFLLFANMCCCESNRARDTFIRVSFYWLTTPLLWDTLEHGEQLSNYLIQNTAKNPVNKAVVQSLNHSIKSSR